MLELDAVQCSAVQCSAVRWQVASPCMNAAVLPNLHLMMTSQ